MAGATFAELAEMPEPSLVPILDRPNIDEDTLTLAQAKWRRSGLLILRGFLPPELMDAYSEARAKLNEPGGWPDPCPYLHVPELRKLALYPPLMAQMRELIGEPMMLHLCLTGWVSTERAWHQDDYLNPPFVNSWYAAVWMALDDIHPDSGPFEYVPGSHRWPLLRGEKVRALMAPREARSRHWPKTSESFVVPALEAEINAQGAAIEKFIAKRGDALIWHGRLVHRGSKPNVPGMMRKALICHYSGISHRPDFWWRRRDDSGSTFAVPARVLARQFGGQVRPARLRP